MKKRKILTGVVAAVLVIAAVAGMILMPRMKKEPVKVVSVGEISYPGYGPGGSESFGQVTTDMVQTAYPSDTQTITELLVTQGQQVKAGDVLFTYDTTLSDLALERKDLSVRQMEMELKRARAELTRLNGLRPMVIPQPVEPPPTKPTEPLESYDSSPELEKLGTAYAGEGTAKKPYYYWLSEKKEITDPEIEKLLGEKDSVYVVFQLVQGDREHVPFAMQFGVRYTRLTEDPSIPEPTLPPETEPSVPETTAPAETEPVQTGPSVPDPSEPAETEPSVPENSAPAETEPVETEPAPAPAARIYAGRSGDFGYGMTFFDYTKINQIPEPEQPELPEIDFGSGFTQTELVEMRRQQQELIRELEFNIRMGTAELNIMKKEADSGEVTADFDGIVVLVMDPEEARQTGQPILKVAGGGGYYIEGSISELELPDVRVGQTVLIQNWDNGTSCEGTIAEIGHYPVENQDYYGSNQNLSFYPYRVFIEETADLMEGSYVSMSLQADVVQEDQMFLDNAFLRTEGKRSYVYVRGENGKLTKRYVQAGAASDGYATPILSGLSEADFVAFPYGPDVREGAPTVEASMEEIYRG